MASASSRTSPHLDRILSRPATPNPPSSGWTTRASGAADLARACRSRTPTKSTSPARVVLATVDGNRDSGDSQFYILLADYDNLLQGTGTVFGRVVLGMEAVDKIELGDKILSAQILTG